jgi:adenosylcobinamide-GDP ribazoletransferase
MSPISATCWLEISEMSGNGEFLNALRFMTIVPVPSSDAATAPDWLSRCAKYFPAVGICIGFVSAAVLLLAGAIWGPVIAALLAVATSIVVTGALHEDGLADTADGFGGGRSVEKRLAIMKDSRIGAYGALALAFGVALRVTALAEMPLWSGAAALIAAHAAARITPAFVMNALPYAGDTAAMKVSYADAPVSMNDLRFALIVVVCALVPLAFTSILSVSSGLLLGAALAAAIALWARRLINGYTGDVLGAVEQMFEIGFLLGVAAIIQ